MSKVTTLHPKQKPQDYSISAPEGSATRAQIQKMLEHFGYTDNPNAFFEAAIQCLHHLTLADLNNGHIVITPPDSAPVPVPFNEWMRPKPKQVD
jgi:hypothetical protein